ncbi:pyridoxamine 5'-phosphate oxidase family protein [Streptodolium elevatio]|uniref:Pyridoxamine 5'-phosphate oxidase family protein n=1 Tax=Streptodolium elevatio TaxID=3157996 RepID=A0ABV3DEZ1_9ACTN
MATTTREFSAVADDFLRTVAEIKYATMTTVDGLGRPRARVLLPIWEVVDGRPVGWLASFPTRVKKAHLAANPHSTLSYWAPSQNTASADAVTAWVEDPETKHAVWELYRKGSPRGVGYDPRAYWPQGPDDPGYHLLRFDPFRVQVMSGRDLATGRPARIWVADPVQAGR